MCIILAILRSEEITATSVAHILKIMKDAQPLGCPEQMRPLGRVQNTQLYPGFLQCLQICCRTGFQHNLRGIPVKNNIIGPLQHLLQGDMGQKVIHQVLAGLCHTHRQQQLVNTRLRHVEHLVELRAGKRRLLARALDLDDLALVVHDEVQIDFGARILLIDDIFTTGATIDEIARILKEPDADGSSQYIPYRPDTGGSDPETQDYRPRHAARVPGAALVDFLAFAAAGDMIV